MLAADDFIAGIGQTSLTFLRNITKSSGCKFTAKSSAIALPVRLLQTTNVVEFTTCLPGFVNCNKGLDFAVYFPFDNNWGAVTSSEP